MIDYDFKSPGHAARNHWPRLFCERKEVILYYVSSLCNSHHTAHRVTFKNGTFKDEMGVVTQPPWVHPPFGPHDYYASGAAGVVVFCGGQAGPFVEGLWPQCLKLKRTELAVVRGSSAETYSMGHIIRQVCVSKCGLLAYILMKTSTTDYKLRVMDL